MKTAIVIRKTTDEQIIIGKKPSNGNLLFKIGASNGKKSSRLSSLIK